MAISEERREYLRLCWSDETEDAYTEVWRDELTDEEQALVAAWDSRYFCGLETVLKAISEAKPH